MAKQNLKLNTPEARVELANVAINAIKQLAELEVQAMKAMKRGAQSGGQRSTRTDGIVLASQANKQQKAAGGNIANDGIDTRGYKKPNGRWKMLNQLFDEKGFDLPSSELWEEANKRSKKLGMEPLKKNSFYSMMSIAKSKAREEQTA